jgi:hypothetical protein
VDAARLAVRRGVGLLKTRGAGEERVDLGRSARSAARIYDPFASPIMR